MRRFISLRKEHPVFGLGTYEPLTPSNPRIFAHVRRYEDDVMLCVHNLARSAQAVELDLSEYEGRYPVELFGRSRFPRIGELPYLLTLAPRGFYWFQLVEPEERGGRRSGDLLVLARPRTRCATGSCAQRWFGSKATRGRARSTSLEAFTLREESPQLVLALVEARFPQGTHEIYQVPIGIRPAAEGWDDRVIAEAGGCTVYDALADPAHARELLHLMRAGADVQAGDGMLALPLGGRRRRAAGRSTCGRSASSSRTRRSCSARR